MNWYEKLYVGENAQKKATTYIQKIENGKYPVQIYLIAFSTGDHARIEIFSSRNYRFWYHQKKSPLIVGIALGREEALDLLQRIIHDVLWETGQLDYHRYFCPGKA